MKLDYSVRLKSQMETRLRDVFSAAQCYGSLSKDMEARKHEVLATMPKDSPQWIRYYLDGYWRCMRDHAYRFDLVYGGMIDGVFYSTHSDRDDYYEKHGMSARVFAELVDGGKVERRGHYWKKTLRPFFVG